MTKLKMVGAAALALASLTPVAATAQWGGAGWHPWRGHTTYYRGWTGPTWYGVRGPHYGWYRYHGRYYRECGYRIYHGRRVWTCR